MLNKRNELLRNRKLLGLVRLVPLAAVLILFFFAANSYAGNQVMGEVQFEGVTKVERDSGVWIDGQYIGYLKEIKGDKKGMMMPVEHPSTGRQAGVDRSV